MNVLATIRLLLIADNRATRASIKQVSPELSHRHIAETLAENHLLLVKNKTGQITGLRSFGFSQMTDNGQKFYHPYDFTNYGQLIFPALSFKGADDLAEAHKGSGWIGGLGDCYQSYATKDSPELRAELEARGYREWNPDFGKAEAFWKEAEA